MTVPFREAGRAPAQNSEGKKLAYEGSSACGGGRGVCRADLVDRHGEGRGLKQFTLALWVKTRQAVAAQRAQFWKNPTVLGAASSGPGSADVAVMLEDGKPGYHHGLEPQQDVSLFSDRTIHDGQWHHLALTRDVDSKGTLYLNELSLDANLNSWRWA